MKKLRINLMTLVLGMSVMLLFAQCGPRAQSENLERTNAVTVLQSRSSEINNHISNIDASLTRNDYNEVATQAERIQLSANDIRTQAEYLSRDERRDVTTAADRIVVAASELKNFAREGATKQNQARNSFATLRTAYEDLRMQLVDL